MSAGQTQVDPRQVAHDQIAARVQELAAEHPELKLSFGYIGNLERWGDDRSWRIFTNRRNKDGRSVSYWLGSWDNLPADIATMTEGRLNTFITHALTCDKAY